MAIQKLLEKISNINPKNIYLYFIIRVLRDGVKKTSKSMNKHEYNVYQIDIDDEIRNHLYQLTKDKLESLSLSKVEFEDYDVITDDINSLFRYQIINKEMPFAAVLSDKLKSPPKIINLDEDIKFEKLWAYCVGFYEKDFNWIYTFRKIFPGKVAIDEKENNNRNIFQKVIRTIFNTNSQKLEILQGETIFLDKQIDCIFYEDTFYIFKKGNFEQIIGLEEEFKEKAEGVLDELKSTEMVEGLDILEKQIKENPSIHKKLIRLAKIGNYQKLNSDNITKMQEICEKYGEKLKIKEGKLYIEDEKDIEPTLKILCDYYKLGEVTGKAYGTYAGKQLKTKK